MPRAPESTLAGDDVSRLLQAWSRGDSGALDRLTPIVYDELRRLARRHLRGERNGHSLQATALVNEAYVRLVDLTRIQWQDRAHFFAVSAQVMRRILVDRARRRNAKRAAVSPTSRSMTRPSWRLNRHSISWPLTRHCRRLHEWTPAKRKWWRCGSSAA